MDDNSNDKARDARIDFSVALGGLVQGLDSLVQVATQFTKGVDGASVRVAPRRVLGEPRIAGLHRHVRRGTAAADAREPMVDVLDEGDHFLVVAEMPGVEEPAVRWSVPGNLLLVIDARAGDRKYYREIPLSAPVQTTPAAASCRNGVLELKLWKQRNG